MSDSESEVVQQVEEILNFVKKQHEWLGNIQTDLIEKDKKYSILYKKFNEKLKKMRNQTVSDCFEEDNEDLLGNESMACSNQENSDSEVDTNEPEMIIKSENGSDHFENDEIITTDDESGNAMAVEYANEQDPTFTHQQDDELEIIDEQDKEELKNTSSSSEPILVNKSEVHKNTNRFECRYCKQVFPEFDELDVHMVEHGKIERKCNFCNKKFCNIVTLDLHVASLHSGPNPYKCTKCGTRFSKSTYLKRHMSTTHGEHKFKCKFCDKAFRYSESLRNHTRLHTGETPFNCHLCDKKFKYRASLVVHIRKHNGIKPYKCEICKQKFVQKCHLVSHNKLHRKTRT